MRYFVSFFLLCGIVLGAGEVSFPPDSLFRVEEVDFKLYVAYPNWKGKSVQSSKTVVFPGESASVSDGFSVRRGKFLFRESETFALEERRKTGRNGAEFKLELTSEVPVNVQMIMVTASIPFAADQGQSFRVNGRHLEFPAYYVSSGRWQIGIPARENRIEIPLRRGVLKISGNFQAQLQDNRKFNRKLSSLRLIFAPSGGAVTHAGLAFRMEYEPYASTPLSFSETGTVRSPLNAGERRLGGIRFHSAEYVLPTGKELEMKNARGNFCYVLSADSVPSPLHITCADGSSAKPELLGKYPVGAEKKDTPVCFAYRIADKPLRSIRFEGKGTPLAVSLSRERIQPVIPVYPLLIQAGREWSPVVLKKDVIPGSALDFSALLDAPAGKYGFLKAVGENFEFEKRPGVPVRFWGINVSSRAIFVPNEDIDCIVKRFAANGYNLVRLHHFDAYLAKAGAAETVTLDPEKVDRLDYFLASCKKHGLYVSIDLYMSRKLKKGEIRRFPDKAVSGREFKVLALIDEEVMRNLEQYSENLLTRVNPYTGLRWTEDPALATVSIINEGTLSNNLRAKYVRDIYDAAFRGWQKKNPGRSRSEFYHEVYRNAYARYSGKLRAMGLKIPLTDLNYIMDVSTARDRRLLDYVDIHYYWAHPVSGNMPRTASPEDALGAFGGFSTLFPFRAFGRPFAVTEWNYVFPNAYRAEGGFLVGAYSALQNYSMLCRFDYVSNPLRSVKPAHIIGFELSNDPVARLTDLAGALFFLRGDASVSGKRFAYRIPDTDQDRFDIPDSFRELGLIAQTGYVLDGSDKSVTVIPEKESLNSLRKKGLISSAELAADGMRCSSTGEIRMQTKRRTFQVVTPRSEGFVGPAGTELHGKRASVKLGNAFSALLIASCDKTPLAESGRVLILHLTDCLNSRLRFSTQERHTVEEFGKLPLLVRRSTAEVTLHGVNGNVTLYALDLSGKRTGKIPVRSENGNLMFRLDNSAGVFAYELIRK